MVADSVTPETRTKTVSDQTSVRLLANSLGPLLQVALLLCLREDHWETWLLRRVICVGCILWPLVVAWTYKIKELPPLEKTQGQQNSRASVFSQEDLDRRVCGVKVRWWLAITLEVVTLITSVGAGMTVKYFPLFFRVDYGLTPVQLCLLTFTYPVAIAGMVQVCQRVGKRMGRLNAVILFHISATCCLWMFCYSRSLPLVVALYLLRGALMNARGPIVRAIIMDLVSSDLRGRWSSIQSVSQFSWSGSAFIGGYIADASGDYRTTFVVTACIYTVSGLCVLPLLWIYPDEKASVRAVESVVQPSACANSSPSMIATDAVTPKL